MYNKKVLSKAVKELHISRTPKRKSSNTNIVSNTKPIVSNQGYKQGPPPEGTHYRILGDTLYNPTPYSITAVSDNGIVKELKPYDETPVLFPGATEIDEYHHAEEGIEVELTDEEIQAYRDGGYIVEELPQAQNGGQRKNWKLLDEIEILTKEYQDLKPNDPRKKLYEKKLKEYNEALSGYNKEKDYHQYQQNAYEISKRFDPTNPLNFYDPIGKSFTNSPIDFNNPTDFNKIFERNMYDYSPYYNIEEVEGSTPQQVWNDYLQSGQFTDIPFPNLPNTIFENSFKGSYRNRDYVTNPSWFTSEEGYNLYDFPNYSGKGYMVEYPLGKYGEFYTHGPNGRTTLPPLTSEIEDLTNFEELQQVYPRFKEESHKSNIKDLLENPTYINQFWTPQNDITYTTFSPEFDYEGKDKFDYPDFLWSTNNRSGVRRKVHKTDDFRNYVSSDQKFYPMFNEPEPFTLEAPIAPSGTYEEEYHPYTIAKAWDSENNKWNDIVVPTGSTADKQTKVAEEWRLKNIEDQKKKGIYRDRKSSHELPTSPEDEKKRRRELNQLKLPKNYFQDGGLIKAQVGKYVDQFGNLFKDIYKINPFAVKNLYELMGNYNKYSTSLLGNVEPHWLKGYPYLTGKLPASEWNDLKENAYIFKEHKYPSGPLTDIEMEKLYGVLANTREKDLLKSLSNYPVETGFFKSNRLPKDQVGNIQFSDMLNPDIYAYNNNLRNLVNSRLYGGYDRSKYSKYLEYLAYGIGATSAAFLAGLTLSDPTKNSINRKIGYPLYPTAAAGDPSITLKDTVINLNNNELTYGQVNDKPEGRILIGGDFIDRNENTVRPAKNWLENKYGTFGDRYQNIESVKSYYGIEDGKLKLGSPESFRSETKIVPNRYDDGRKVYKAKINDDNLRLVDKKNKPIYHNAQRFGKLILYSEDTGNSIFVSHGSSPESTKQTINQINNFIKDNKNVKPIIIDNGRYVQWMHNEKGLTNTNYDNFYSNDFQRGPTAGYNIIIKKDGGAHESLPKAQLGNTGREGYLNISSGLNTGTPGMYRFGNNNPTFDIGYTHALGSRARNRLGVDDISVGLTAKFPYANNTGMGIQGDLNTDFDEWHNFPAHTEANFNVGYDPHLGMYSNLMGSPQFNFGNVPATTSRRYGTGLKAGEFIGSVGPFGGASFFANQEPEKKVSFPAGVKGHVDFGIGRKGVKAGLSGYAGADLFGGAEKDISNQLKSRYNYGVQANLKIPIKPAKDYTRDLLSRVKNMYAQDEETFRPRIKHGGLIKAQKGLNGLTTLGKYVKPAASLLSTYLKPFQIASQSPLFSKYSNVLKNINPEGFGNRFEMASLLSDMNYVGPEFDFLAQMNASKTEDAMNALMQKAIKHDLTGWRQVNPKTIPYKNRFNETVNIDAQRQAMRDAGVDFSDYPSRSQYMATHVPKNIYGDREGGMDRLGSMGMDALYLAGLPQLEMKYAPHQWRVTQPFDFSTGNWNDWFTRHTVNKQPIITEGQFNPKLNPSEVFFDSGYSKGDVLPRQYGMGQGINTRRWASGKGAKIAEPDLDNPFPAFYDFYTISPTERELLRQEQEAVQKGWSTGWADQYRKGGAAKVGDLVDKATMEKLIKEGYTFEEV